MTSIPYDTLKVARRLTEAGLDAKTAEGVSATFADVWAESENALATKSDIREVRSELRELRSELRGELRLAVSDILKWVIGSQIALVGLLFAAIRLL